MCSWQRRSSRRVWEYGCGGRDLTPAAARLPLSIQWRGGYPRGAWVWGVRCDTNTRLLLVPQRRQRGESGGAGGGVDPDHISHPHPPLASPRLCRVGCHLVSGVGAGGVALSGVVLGQPV